MIRVLDASIRDVDSANVIVHFILQDDSGDGIRWADVLDRERVRIHREEGDCGDHPLEFDVVAPRTALPLWVQGEDCAGRVTDPDVAGPFLLPLVPPGPALCGGPLLCLVPNAACVEAEAALALARGSLAPRCGECERLRRQQSQAERLCAALWTALLVMFAAAAAALSGGGIFGAIVALFILAIIVFLGVQQAIACHDADLLKERAERCEAEVAELRLQFESALTAALTHCCPECLSTPTSAPC